MAEGNGFAEGVVTGMATDRGNYGYGVPMVPAVPAYGYGGNYGGGCGGFGGCGDWVWIIILFALFGNGFGFGGDGVGGSFPWLLQGQNNTDNNVNAGFNHAATQSALSGIQNDITTGFSNAEVAACNRALASQEANYQNVITGLQQNFAMQQAFSNCCCENRLGIADLKATILQENCADRAVLSDGVRDIITNATANTQKILDTLCQDKIDAKNEKIADLERQLTMANLNASQIAQTAQLRAGQNAEVDALYNRLMNCPVPSVPVYGRQPIFTCSNAGCGCGCGNTTL
jgi:hypothetical protein